MFTPLCDIWAAPHGRIFLLRSYPHKPNRARRAQSAHIPNCGYVPNRGDGAGQRIYYRWPRATMRRQGRRETPACEVYPNRRRAFWGTLDRSVERSRASPRSGRSKGPSDAQRPRGGVTRKGEPSGPGYAGHILCMCRRPLCPFQRPYTAVRYTSANTFLAIRTSKFATCDFGGATATNGEHPAWPETALSKCSSISSSRISSR